MPSMMMMMMMMTMAGVPTWIDGCCVWVWVWVRVRVGAWVWVCALWMQVMDCCGKWNGMQWNGIDLT